MKFTFPRTQSAGQRPSAFPVIPVFMPFAGCCVRCVFCAQTSQTGTSERQLPAILDELFTVLESYETLGRGPVEVAFYGGTFTALSLKDQLRCLELTRHWQTKGLVDRVRCSTRPDCIDREGAAFLRQHGVSLVELGVQSFSNEALRISRRNYTAERVIEACATIKDEGLELGVQLMPGLPGATLADAYRDIDLAVEQKPSCVRLYPCLVFAGTPLAQMWEAGDYRPLGLEETVNVLAYACLAFGKNDIPIIRMGVAPEPSAMEQLLAGPFHPSLGNMARGKALFEHIATQITLFRSQGVQVPTYSDERIKSVQTPLAQATASGGEASSAEGRGVRSLRLFVPQNHQGDFWGFKGQLKAEYAALGVGEVVFTDTPEFSLDWR